MAGTTTKAKAGQLRPIHLPTGQSHKIILSFPRAFVLDVEDEHFNTDRSLLLPDPTTVDGSVPTLDERRVRGLGTIYAALVHAEKFPAQKMMVTGHTDAPGSTKHNLALSEARAEVTSCLLRGQRERFRELAAAKDAVDDVQAVLQWQHLRAGWDCDPGGVDNKLGQKTKRAIRRFQELYNLDVLVDARERKDSPWKDTIKEDGKIGPETWGAIYDVYMGELMDLLGLATFAELKARQARLEKPPGMVDFVGCGEHARVDPKRRDAFEAKDDGLAEPEEPMDRRVEILFFDPGEEVPLACHATKGKCDASVCPLYGPVPFQLKPIGIPKGLPIMEANLRLTFLDPEGKERPLPAGIKVQALFGDPADPFLNPPELDPDATMTPSSLGEDDPPLELDENGFLKPRKPEPAPVDEAPFGPPPPPPAAVSTQADGLLQFEVPRKAKTLFLRFIADEKSFVSANLADLADTTLVDEKTAREGVARGRAFFRLPEQMDTRDGYWKAGPAVKFDKGMFLEVDDKATQLGERGAPMPFTLQPKWQFFRFDYFDRWTSSFTSVGQTAAQGEQPPRGEPLVLEGYARFLPAKVPARPAAHSAWSLPSGKHTVHCLGWPRRQFAADGTARVLPDTVSSARFAFGKPTFVETAGDGKSPDAKRTLVSFAEEDKTPRTPGVQRLRLYDLPGDWRSPDYPMVLGDEKVEKRRVFQKEPGDTSSLAKPYAFSLDLVFLERGKQADGTFEADPVWDDKKIENRFTVYDHQLRVHVAETKLGETYFTSLDKLARKPDGRILHDVPAFTRLITRNILMWDVFDARLPAENNQGFPIGARLARRFLDSGKDKLAFTEYDRSYQVPRPDGIGGALGDLGGTVTVLLRCCGREGDAELFHFAQYLYVHLDFEPKVADKKVDPDSKLMENPPRGDDAIRKISGMLTAVSKRWNGGDSRNPDRTEFTIGQPVKAKGSFNFLLTRGLPNKDSFQKSGSVRVNIIQEGRAFMEGNDTSGQWKFKDLESDAELNERFTAAHELGHILGQPDEYHNTDSEPSMDQPNIVEQGRSPGNPFGIDQNAMMVENRDTRARYFWHLVLWAREQGHFLDTSNIFVRQGTKVRFTAPLTPLLGNPTVFPTLSARNKQVGRGLCDVFVYPMGRDQWTAGILGGSKTRPYDGFVSVRVKMDWHFPDVKAFDTLRTQLARAFTTIVGHFNVSRKLVVNGVLDGKAKRLRVLFAPRFILRTFPATGDTKKFIAAIQPQPETMDQAGFNKRADLGVGAAQGVHCKVLVGDGRKPGITGVGSTTRDAGVRMDVERIFFDDEFFEDDVLLFFSQMVGLPNTETFSPERFRPLFVGMGTVEGLVGADPTFDVTSLELAT